MRVALFEDRPVADLGPLVLLRPAFELLCGRYSLRERLLRRLDVTAWGAFVRPLLAEHYRERHSECRINDAVWLTEGPTLLVHGRWLPDAASLAVLERLDEDHVACLNDRPAALWVQPEEAPLLEADALAEGFERLALSRYPQAVGGRWIERPWDVVEQNARQLADDFPLGRTVSWLREFPPHVAILGPTEHVRIHASAQIEPFVVVDAREGPVTVDADVVLGAFTRLQGPCHIGRASRLFAAQVRGGTTIGPVCRVGGEIEASVLHGYVNKYHAGFVGHAYVGPWTNLGALSTNSDLKNDYSTVRVPVAGAPIETGLTKVGCFIGDHTKTGLGSLFNTGSSIGVMCMILPAGRLLPKHVPSFCRVWHGRLDDGLDLDAAIDAERIVMGRRNCELTASYERLLRRVFEQTQQQRAEAIEQAARRAVRS